MKGRMTIDVADDDKMLVQVAYNKNITKYQQVKTKSFVAEGFSKIKRHLEEIQAQSATDFDIEKPDNSGLVTPK